MILEPMFDNKIQPTMLSNDFNQYDSVTNSVTAALLKHYQSTVDSTDGFATELSTIFSIVISETLKGYSSHITIKKLSQLSHIENNQLRTILKKPLFINIESANETLNDSPSTPFVVYQDSIYMGRYWKAERAILDKLAHINQHHATNQNNLIHTQQLEANLSLLKERLSPSQRGIIALFCQQHTGITIISGEAGSGKSWASTQLMKTIESHQPHALIAICAPTGKAVSRLSTEFPESSTIDIQTIHQLLKLNPNSHRPQYHNENRLAYEFILIDEVSMIDIELLAKLSAAIRHDCKIILVGDPNQLAPVGVGGSLKLIQDYFPNHHIHLQEQYRFSQNSEIQRLSELAKDGKLLATELPPPHNLCANATQQQALLEQWIAQNLYPCYQPKSLLKLLDKCVLSPWRNYENGIINLNQFIQKKLYDAKLIEKPKGWCEGLIIVIRSNDFKLAIYNGDKAYLKKEGNQLYAVFIDKGNRQIPLHQLHRFDLAFAMTVHQTQGAEMDDVLLWLGSMNERSKKWLSNNLLYTSITRAKKTIQICADINGLKKLNERE